MTDLVLTTGDGFVRLDGHGEAGPATLEGSGAACLAVDSADPDVIYVGCRGAGVLKSRDGGGTWTDTQLPHSDVFSVAVSPADGAVYAGCEPSMLFRSDDAGGTWRELEALRRIPSAPTWSFPPRPWTSHVRWIAPSPHDPTILLVGIELGGLMYSGDGGRTWLDHRPGAQRDVHALAWHPRAADRAYEAGGGGAAWSHDGGRHWGPADDGRADPYVWGLAVDPREPDCWYVSAAPGPMKAHGGGSADAHLYRWRGEGPWRRLGGGLPDPLDSMPYALVALDGELFAGLGDGRILNSTDGGDSWAPMPGRVDRVMAMAAVPD